MNKKETLEALEKIAKKYNVADRKSLVVDIYRTVEPVLLAKAKK